MKRVVSALMALVVILSMASCGKQTSENGRDEKWSAYKNFYTTSIHYTGENDSTQKYLEIAERSAELFPLLEGNAGAFVCDVYNYQSIDEDGTPLYTMNGMHYPQEIAPNGQSIRVSRNYFQYNPIETVNGIELDNQIIYDDLTLNVLVPEKYRDMEGQIDEAYSDYFYFGKVQAENDYNEMAGIDERLDIPKDSLHVNIIYVKDGQRYFTFRSDCAAATNNWISDPVVQIYTSNIHCNYAHSFLSQWTYFYSEKGTADEAYQDIKADVEACGAEESLQNVVSVYEANR